MKKFFRKYLHSPKHQRQLQLFNTLLILLLIAGLGYFWFKDFIKDYDQEKMRPKDRLITRLAKAPDIIFFPFLFLPSQTDIYRLTIDSKNLKSLNENLPQPYSRIVLQKKHKKTVPAKFKFNDQEYEVKVRYTGDLYPHWSNIKKSWAINFKDNPFEGKKSFDLVIPERRSLILAMLNFYRAKKLNLVIPEHKFVRLIVNGKDIGVYLLTESWSEEFLEKNQRTPYGNLYGEQDGAWDDFSSPGSNHLYMDLIFWKRHIKSEIEELKTGGELGQLIDLLNNASDKQFNEQIERLIDLENFYLWQTSSMLIGDYHQNWWHNARLYFNPTKGKFEFFPVDVKRIAISKFIDLNYNPLVTRILLNPEFLYQRNKILWDYVSDENNLKDDLSFYDKEYQKVWLDFLKDRVKFFSNLGFLITVKNDRKDIIRQFENIYGLLSDCRVSIVMEKIENYQSFEKVYNLRITNYGYATALIKNFKNIDGRLFFDSNKNSKLDSSDSEIDSLSDIDFKLFVERKKPADFPEGFLEKIEPQPTSYQFFLLTNENLEDLPDIEILNAVTSKKIKAEISLKEEIGVEPQILGFQKEGENLLVLPAGSYNFKENIIIPQGYQVEIKPGATLRFSPGISLISMSPIKALGFDDNPIVFSAINPEEGWGILSVNQIKSEKSQFENVIIEYGGEAFVGGVKYTGALSSFYSDIEIKNSIFRHNRGDDAVNVKYGQALISENRFYKNEADALDLDYTSGKILDNIFEDNGNDAIDLGSSSPEIINNKVFGSSDKCLSLGEESAPKVIENYFSGCQMGIAIKDSSTPEIIRNEIVNNDIGVATYIKKPIFSRKEFTFSDNLLKDNQKDEVYD